MAHSWFQMQVAQSNDPGPLFINLPLYASDSLPINWANGPDTLKDFCKTTLKF